jgi:hypothetical protein
MVYAKYHDENDKRMPTKRCWLCQFMSHIGGGPTCRDLKSFNKTFSEIFSKRVKTC